MTFGYQRVDVGSTGRTAILDALRDGGELSRATYARPAEAGGEAFAYLPLDDDVRERALDNIGEACGLNPSASVCLVASLVTEVLQKCESVLLVGGQYVSATNTGIWQF